MGYFHPVIGDDSAIVGGRDLRYLLTWRMRRAGRSVSVAELVNWCTQIGVVLPGRPSKVISDALRWEISWNRVERLSRGEYRFVKAPKSTWAWICRRVQALMAHIEWARSKRRGEPASTNPPVWGPDVTTPPGSGRRAMQPINPVLRLRRQRYKRVGR